MLTEAITKRFWRHHAYLLGYMDAAEEVVRELAETDQPVQKMTDRKAFFSDFLEFLETNELQHEMEEEKVLLPVLEEQLLDSKNSLAQSSMQRMCQEHCAGRRLIQDLRLQVEALHNSQGSPRNPVLESCLSLTLEIIWHFRKHVWAENSIIFPAAERLIPDSADELWTLNRLRRGQTNA